MSFVELLLIAVGLSMDAFAVAVCKGLQMKEIDYKQGFTVALSFGFFQGLMPLLGWYLGTGFGHYISDIDHWVAFILLAFIGGKMIFEALSGEDEAQTESGGTDLKELLMLSIATSIDALAVGITFALLPDTDIWSSVITIALTTFLLSFLGVVVGNRFGSRYEKKAELLGGVILVLIGLKILLEHLGYINF